MNYLLFGFPFCSFPLPDYFVLFEHFHQKGDERKEKQLVSNPFNASEGPTDEASDFLSAWGLDDWFSFLPIDLVPSRKPWLQKACSGVLDHQCCCVLLLSFHVFPSASRALCSWRLGDSEPVPGLPLGRPHKIARLVMSS